MLPAACHLVTLTIQTCLSKYSPTLLHLRALSWQSLCKCLCRERETPAASQGTQEAHRLRQELAQMRHENAELRAALQDACLASLPPEAAQYVQVSCMLACPWTQGAQMDRFTV